MVNLRDRRTALLSNVAVVAACWCFVVLKSHSTNVRIGHSEQAAVRDSRKLYSFSDQGVPGYSSPVEHQYWRKARTCYSIVPDWQRLIKPLAEVGRLRVIVLSRVESSLQKYVACSGSWEAHIVGQKTFFAAMNQRDTLYGSSRSFRPLNSIGEPSDSMHR